jgi:hypothetical protein
MKTCSILTTTPNAVTLAIHDRMPVALAAIEDKECCDSVLARFSQNGYALSQMAVCKRLGVG